MSVEVVVQLRAKLADKLLETSAFRGDDEVLIAAKDWLEVARFLKEDETTAMDQFVDLTAVDYPEREPELPRFDVLLSLRALDTGRRIRVKTRVRENEKLATLVEVWAGADWAEREVYDMFGIEFEGHPDPRRILMYEEFEGYPLRKDYPIDKAQPLVPYRDEDNLHKLPPFGIEEGQPFARIDWEARLAGRDAQVSPAIALQQGQRRTLSDSETAEYLKEKLERDKPADQAENS